MDNQHSLIGLQIDQYRISRHLAQGGMADVYLAQDVNLKREAIIKVMLPQLVQDQNFMARFQREAQTTAQLNHPNIIQVYSSGFTADGRPYLAMQYIRGGSLHDRLHELDEQKQLMTTLAALTVTRQIADALDAAHRAGIVHRDLKPSNILLHPNGTPVLTDLGIAAVSTATRLTQTGTVMGTPYYMSPEQAQGKPPDGRSDIYALGVILHELLTGAPPFQAESPLAVLHQQIYEPPPPLERIRPNLSLEIYAIVDTCLQKEPERRFHSAAELVTAVDRALAAAGTPYHLPETDTGRQAIYGQTITRGQIIHPITPRPAPPEKPAGRRKWAIPLVVLAVLLAGALIVWQRPFTFSSNLPPSPTPTSSATPLPQPTEPETAVAAAEATSTIAPTNTAVPTSTPSAIPTQTATPLPTNTPTPTSISIPQRNQIVFQSNRDGDFEIYIMDMDGRNQTQLTNNQTDDKFPVVSSDGSRVVFQSNQNGNWAIYSMDIDGRNRQQLTDSADNGRLPTWSPDSQKIAFLSDRDGDYEIYTLNADGSDLRQLTFDTLYTGHMSWSINDEIVFNNAGSSVGSWEIFVMDADGQNLRQLTSNSVDDWSPEWSPDGRTILYLTITGSNDPTIYLMNADGSNPHQLYNTNAYEWGAHWAAGGTQILFTKEEGDTSYIYIMNSDGSNARLVSERGSYPSWVK